MPQRRRALYEYAVSKLSANSSSTGFSKIAFVLQHSTFRTCYYQVMSHCRNLIFSIALLSSVYSLAGDCDPVDFSAEMGPVRNQGKTGWCYAFTAADLIGFEIGLTPAEQVSATDVAAATYLENPRELEARLSQMTTANLGYVTQLKRNMLIGAVRSLDANRAHWWGMPLAAREGGFEYLAIAVYNMRGGACLESKVASQKSEIFLNSGEFLWGKYGFKRYTGVDQNSMPLRTIIFDYPGPVIR